MALVETDSDPHLIEFEKKEEGEVASKVKVIQVFSAYSHPPDDLYN